MKHSVSDTKPLVSVLMPSLNVGQFIDQCMQSVLGQTLQNIEIICIDAGSTDGTLEALRAYETQDERVRVIVSDKKSYGYQMNLGLDAARGEYIGIIETDDWAEPNMFEELVRVAKASQADVAKSNYFEYSTSPTVSNVLFKALASIGDGVFVPRDSLDFIGATPAIWSGIYRREMLEREVIRFNESPGASYQDTAFYLMVCVAAKSAVALQDGYLHYRIDNEESSVKSAGKVYCVCDEMRYFEAWLAGRGESDLLPRFMITRFKKYRWNYRRLAPEFQWEFLCAAHKEFVERERNGALDPELFAQDDREELRLLLRDPVILFQRTCKPHAVRLTSRDLPAAEVVVRAKGGRPLVSVVLVARDEADSVRRLLEAFVVGCKVGPDDELVRLAEVVCVDDGSVDDTQRVMAEFAQASDSVTVLSQMPLGDAAAWDHGIAEARGDYVLLARARDVIPPAQMLVDVARRAVTSKADLIVAEGYGDAAPASGAEWLAGALAADKPWESLADKMPSRKLIVAHDLLLCQGVVGSMELFVLDFVTQARGVKVAGRWLLAPSYVRVNDVCTSLRIAMEMSHVAGTLPYSDELQRAAAAEVEKLSRQAAARFLELDSEGERTVKRELTPVEWQYLEYCLDHLQLAKLRESQGARVAKKVKSQAGRVKRFIGKRIR